MITALLYVYIDLSQWQKMRQIPFYMVSEPHTFNWKFAYQAAAMAENVEQPKNDSLKRSLSPYDLKSNDNSRNVITHVQLQGENYEEWAWAMPVSSEKVGFYRWNHSTAKEKILWSGGLVGSSVHVDLMDIEYGGA